MYRILGLVIIVPLVIWMFIKMVRSPKYDKFCKDIVDGKLDTDPTSKDAMKDITKSETSLGKQAEINTKAAVNLKTETNGINKFLGKRGVANSANEKKEGSQ